MTGVFFGIVPVCLYDKLYNRDDGDVLRDVAADKNPLEIYECILKSKLFKSWKSYVVTV